MTESHQRRLPVSTSEAGWSAGSVLEPGERCVLAQARPGARPDSGTLIVAIPRGLFWASLVTAALLGAATLVGGQAGSVRFRSQMTVEEFERCGLPKLSAEELVSLEAWFERRSLGSKAGPPEPGAASASFAPGPSGMGSALAPGPPGPASDPLVAFNVSTHKYHCPRCRFAVQCTRNCVEIPLSQAQARGGRPCGSCGGACR